MRSCQLPKAPLRAGPCVRRTRAPFRSAFRARVPSATRPTHKHAGLNRIHSGTRPAAVAEQAVEAAAQQVEEGQVLDALRKIIDPDFGKDIVECGFVKNMSVNAGSVAFTLELTTPACPIKDEFQRQAEQNVKELPWVTDVTVNMTAAASRPDAAAEANNGRPMGLKNVRHIIAVSSCKGGVGKSTVSVNLAYTLAQMGAKVGIFDADVYGPSLPSMVSPEVRVMKMDPETKGLTPVEYQGVKVVSFGFAGKGSAIMRGPMVSGLIQQLMLTADWGELDYLVCDFPPGTGDIQLTLCQTVAFSAAVIITTPQRLAFIDVAKGIRMFAKLAVPCVAVVENMSYFEADGRTYRPFGEGSGERIQRDFGLPNLVKFPIMADLSAAGDGGVPHVVEQPTSSTSRAFMELGAVVVREVAKLQGLPRSAVTYDAERQAVLVQLPGSEPFLLHPASVRRNDTSASSVNEWTGERMLRDEDVREDIQPESINPLGNYAVQISWQDGFNQVASFELLEGLRHMALDPRAPVPSL